MKAAEFDANLYRSPVTLWVEDHLTRAFLMELWGDTDIVVRAGGGREGVTYPLGSADPACT